MVLDLIILRGLPGSGKSTLAKIMSENGHAKAWPVFCIDDYFIDPMSKEYNFSFSENHLAYKKCQDNAEEAMKNNIKKIIIDNAFTLSWEIEPYFKLAAKYHYRVFVATVENYHGGKNRHGITDEQVEKMAEKYRVKLS